MTDKKSSGIVFDVETSRILEILSKEIYDSPYAMLRENVQNCYDAILMRKTVEEVGFDNAKIDIQVSKNELVISDTGIGMTEDVLRNNFWRAGSSGKKTELAAKSGVIGTFGIGAMANFGVCSELRIETRSLESELTLISSAKRKDLSIAKECVTLSTIRDDRPPGTTITATLDEEFVLDQSTAINYLVPYVGYLPVPVLVNGLSISGKKFDEALGPFSPVEGLTFTRTMTVEPFTFDMMISLDRNGRVKLRVYNLTMNSEQIVGEILAIQDGGQLMGYRNFFGLAPFPIASQYQLGGVANLSILNPTAGREALSRESISTVNTLLQKIETAVTEILSTADAADRNPHFLRHVTSLGRYDLADKVTIDMYPNKESVQLGMVRTRIGSKKTYVYKGNRTQIIERYSSDESNLLNLSQANPRRKVQSGYINKYLSVDDVPDKPQITREYRENELLIEEAALLVRISVVLLDDYLISNSIVRFAEISHDVQVFVPAVEREEVVIYLARNGSSVKPILECYKTAVEYFSAFVKDFVRHKLYSEIKQYAPSASRGGVEALRKALAKNTELYRYDQDELGPIENLLTDLLSGDRDLAEVITSAKKVGRVQSQKVSPSQVGTMEETLPTIVNSPSVPDAEVVEGTEFEPSSGILRSETQTEMKILHAEKRYAQLNGYDLFLGLSDRLFKREMEFFHFPHTTKLIWAGHRVIYIFAHASGLLTLYYDIELKDPLQDSTAGGEEIRTTTIVTKNRIFVPVIPQLKHAFEVVEGVKEFLVRFDVIIDK